jgi:hypothetical protein
MVAIPRRGTIDGELKTNPICPVDDDSIVPKRLKGDEATVVARVRGDNKRSLDYIARSGLAGGLAGCAVGSNP